MTDTPNDNVTTKVLATLATGAKSKSEICAAMCTEDTKPDGPTVTKTLKRLRHEGKVGTTGQRRGMRYYLTTTEDTEQ